MRLQGGRGSLGSHRAAAGGFDVAAIVAEVAAAVVAAAVGDCGILRECGDASAGEIVIKAGLKNIAVNSTVKLAFIIHAFYCSI